MQPGSPRAWLATQSDCRPVGRVVHWSPQIFLGGTVAKTRLLESTDECLQFGP